MEETEKQEHCHLPPDEDSLRLHIRCTNYIAYLMRNPSLYNRPSQIGNRCMLENWVCRPIKYLKPAIPVNPKNHAANHSSDYADSVDDICGCIENGALENDENENYVDENNSELMKLSQMRRLQQKVIILIQIQMKAK